MSAISRRDTKKGAAASATLIACEAIAKPVTDILVPRMTCGCPRVHELKYGHTCIVHDPSGKRWDAYTIEEIVAGMPGLTIEVQTAETEWSCYCGRHEHCDAQMAVGTRCIWQQTSYEYDEAECECAEAFRASWLADITTDWTAMAKQDGLA